MDGNEARALVIVKMQPVAEHPLILGCSARLADELTEEYDWGWLFVFVPMDADQHGQAIRQDKYALDRVTGNMSPVGKKGIPEALRDLMRWRPHQG